MPGFTIHLAIANEYIRKHKDEIVNRNEFFNGTISPDLIEDKHKSHYRNYGESHIGLLNFLNSKDIDTTTDYGKGYFLHLLADELFYHYYFLEESEYAKSNHKNFYSDYDCLNEIIIEKFKITYIPNLIEKYFNKVEGDLEILTLKKVEDFIMKLSETTIEEQIHKIMNVK